MRAISTSLPSACDRHDPAYYREFKAWCDRYFYLPHRGEPRGAGGIFFDRTRHRARRADFAFTQRCRPAFLDVYPPSCAAACASPGARRSASTS